MFYPGKSISSLRNSNTVIEPLESRMMLSASDVIDGIFIERTESLGQYDSFCNYTIGFWADAQEIDGIDISYPWWLNESFDAWLPHNWNSGAVIDDFFTQDDSRYDEGTDHEVSMEFDADRGPAGMHYFETSWDFNLDILNQINRPSENPWNQVDSNSASITFYFKDGSSFTFSPDFEDVPLPEQTPSITAPVIAQTGVSNGSYLTWDKWLQPGPDSYIAVDVEEVYGELVDEPDHLYELGDTLESNQRLYRLLDPDTPLPANRAFGADVSFVNRDTFSSDGVQVELRSVTNRETYFSTSTPADGTVDLQATILEFPSSQIIWCANDVIDINLMLTNNGSAAAGINNTLVFLSQDRVFGNDDDVIVQEITEEGLNPGESWQINDAMRLLANYVPNGDYYLGIATDHRNLVAESNESNNVVFSDNTIEVDIGIEEYISWGAIDRGIWCNQYESDNWYDLELHLLAEAFDSIAITTPWGETVDVSRYLPQNWNSGDAVEEYEYEEGEWLGNGWDLEADMDFGQPWVQPGYHNIDIEWCFNPAFADVMDYYWNSLDTGSTTLELTLKDGRTLTKEVDFSNAPMPDQTPAITSPQTGQTGVGNDLTLTWDQWQNPGTNANIHLWVEEQHTEQWGNTEEEFWIGHNVGIDETSHTWQDAGLPSNRAFEAGVTFTNEDYADFISVRSMIDANAYFSTSTPEHGKADLQTKILKSSTADVLPGDPIYANFEWSNNGSAASAVQSDIFFLSQDKEFGNADDIVLHECFEEGWNPGDFDREGGHFRVPEYVPAGYYYFGVATDPHNMVDESNEDNNLSFSKKAFYVGAKEFEPQTHILAIGVRDDATKLRSDVIAQWVAQAFDNFESVTTCTTVKLNTSAPGSYDAFVNSINNFAQQVRPQDTAIIYVASHGGFYPAGYADDDEIAVDAQNDANDLTSRLSTTADEYILLSRTAANAKKVISDDDFAELFTTSHWDGVEKLFLMDTCYSGGHWGNLAIGDSGDLTRLDNTALIAAASEDNFAWATWNNSAGGYVNVFGKSIVNSLNGMQDASSISFDELYEAIKTEGTQQNGSDGRILASDPLGQLESNWNVDAEVEFGASALKTDDFSGDNLAGETRLNVPLNKKGVYSWRDHDGDYVTVSLSGGGSGYVVFDADTDGNDADALQIVLSNCTAKSSLTIKVKGPNGTTTLEGISVDGAITVINAKQVDFSGNLEIDSADYIASLSDKVRNKLTASIALGSITNAAIDTGPLGIKSLSFANWTDTDQTRDRIDTEFIGSLSAQGNKKAGLPGNFEADVKLNGADPKKGIALGKMYVAGTINGSIIDAKHGSIGSITAAQWDSGSLDTTWVKSIAIKGNRRDPNITGNLSADLNLTGEYRGVSLGKLSVAGTIDGSTITLGSAGGSITAAEVQGTTLNATWVKSIAVKGNRRDPNITGKLNADLILTGEYRGVSLGKLSVAGTIDGSTITLGSAGGLITAAEVQGTTLNATWVKSIAVKGNRRDPNITGVFNANVNLIGQNRKGVSLDKLTVAGVALNSSVRSAGSMGSVTVGAADGSDLLAGVNAGVSRHAASAGDFVNTAARIGSFKIQGIKGKTGRFLTDSNLSAASFGVVSLLNGDFETGDTGIYAFDVEGDNEIKSIAYGDTETGFKWRWPLKPGQVSAEADALIHIM